MMKLHKEDVAGRLNVEQFSDTVLSKALSRLPEFGESVWLAGGAVRRLFEGKKPDSDFDFFFKDQTSTENFEDELIEMGARLLSENDKNKKYILPSSIPEDMEGEDVYLPEMEIQCINFQYFDSPKAVIDSFDFTICMFAFDGDYFYIGDFSLWDLARKKLVINKVTYGVATVRRLMKYANQGFTACGGCLTQILRSVVDDPNVIQSDTLYVD